MEQRKKPTAEINGQFVGNNQSISSLNINNMNPMSNSRNFMAESISNSKSSTIFGNEFESVCTFQSINRPATKSFQIFKPMSNTRIFSPGSSILRKKPTSTILSPFQLTAYPISSEFNDTKSQKSVAFDTKRIDSFPIAAPPGINSTTINYTNSTLVNSEPVSTEDTAPTKNIIEINTSDFTTNFSKHSIHSALIGTAQNSSATISKFEIPSINSIPLLPVIQSSSNGSVNDMSINLSHTNKTHLEQTFDASNSNPKNQDCQHKYSKQVNYRCRVLMYFILLLVLFWCYFCEINCHHVKFEYRTSHLFKLFSSQTAIQLQNG